MQKTDARQRVVRLARVELATCCFGGNRSIQLSYSRTGVLFDDTADGWGRQRNWAWWLLVAGQGFDLFS
jgi:hypothetical protein